MRALFLLLALTATLAEAQPRHFAYYGRDRDALRSDTLLPRTRGFDGAQVAYFWRHLEPERGRYDFSRIEEDIAFLQRSGKQLWVQLQDVSFGTANVPVPQYIVDEPAYHGGVAPQYRIPGGDESKAVAEGWTMRRWDPAVQERFHLLLAELGRRFDGRIAGVNFAETAIDLGESGRLIPPGFTYAGYRDAVIANMRALKRAFPNTVAMVYANFIPGDWRGDNDGAYIASVYRVAQAEGIAMGGPDLLPHRPWQQRNSLRWLRESAGRIPTGLAVQDGNLIERNPSTGQQVTAAELLGYATDDLRLSYLFWGIEEPFYSRDVVPLVERSVRR